jgi:hypothetical protein
MIKNLVVVVSGGALAFGLAGTVSPAMALASVASPAGVTRANLPMPAGTPIIRDSGARLGGPGHLFAQPDTPIIRDAKARRSGAECTKLMNPPDPPVIKHSTAQNAPPTIRDARMRPECIKLMNPPDTPIVRGSAARFSDPDDGGQVTQAAAQFGDPDDGGQVQVFAALSDPDSGGQ